MVRDALKAAARGVARVAAAPLVASFWLRAACTSRDRSLESSSQLISLVPGVTGQYLRRAFLQSVVASCDQAACIEFGTLFSRINVRIGRSAYIGPRCHIGWAEIGDDALIAAGVHITSGARIHGFADPDVPIREQRGELAMVRIGNGVWIGSNAVVMADVGEGAIVAAGAVVTKPVPPFTIAAGVPARVVRHRVADRTDDSERGYATGELA